MNSHKNTRRFFFLRIPIYDSATPATHPPSPICCFWKKKNVGTRKQSCSSWRTLKENIMDSLVSTAVPPVADPYRDRDVRQSFQSCFGSVLIGCPRGLIFFFFGYKTLLEGRDAAKLNGKPHVGGVLHIPNTTHLYLLCVSTNL